jgi:hypothetical protein
MQDVESEARNRDLTRLAPIDPIQFNPADPATDCSGHVRCPACRHRSSDRHAEPRDHTGGPAVWLGRAWTASSKDADNSGASACHGGPRTEVRIRSTGTPGRDLPAVRGTGRAIRSSENARAPGHHGDVLRDAGAADGRRRQSTPLRSQKPVWTWPGAKPSAVVYWRMLPVAGSRRSTPCPDPT